MSTIWDAATAALAARDQDQAAAEESEATARTERARTLLVEFSGGAELPTKMLHHEQGVIVHDGTRGLLVTDAGTIRYVVRDAEGRITAQGDPLKTLADLGELLA